MFTANFDDNSKHNFLPLSHRVCKVKFADEGGRLGGCAVVVFRCAEIGSHNRSYCLREQYIGCEQHVARQPAQSPPIQAARCVCVCGVSDQGRASASS
jgi:hypothetical protein